MKIKDLETLKCKAENMRQEGDRAQGRLEESQKRLKEEFDMDSSEEAGKLLKKLEAAEQKAQEKLDKAMAKFEEEWADEMGR